MNIIFYRYNSICEPGYMAAFRALGIQISECRHDGDLAERMSGLAEQIGRERPLFVFSINYFPFIAIVCERLHVLYLAVSVDCPVFEIYDRTIRSPYNRIFLFDREQYLSIRDENPAGVFHLPLGGDIGRIEENTGTYADFIDNPAYDYDISFVGSLYREKDAFDGLALSEEESSRLQTLMSRQQEHPGLEILEKELTEEDVEILRRADRTFRSSERSVCDISKRYVIESYLSDHLTVTDRLQLLNAVGATFPGRVHLFTLSDTDGLKGVVCHGGVNSSTEMPLVFRKSRININHTMRAIRTGLPQRIWDVLGSGGFLLTNAQAEIPEYLEVGKHLDVYEDTEELIDKIGYWLSHDEERMTVAMAGYLEVKERHTVLNRVTDMIRQVAGERQQLR